MFLQEAAIAIPPRKNGSCVQYRTLHCMIETQARHIDIRPAYLKEVFWRRSALFRKRSSPLRQKFVGSLVSCIVAVAVVVIGFRSPTACTQSLTEV